MAYHADVEFLEECSPGLVRRNAVEFARMRDLLGAAATSDVVGDEAAALARAFGEAAEALLAYAGKLVDAQRFLEAGVDAADRLDELISSEATAVTRAAQEAEPMRRWEDLWDSEGFLAWLSELGADVDSIRAEAVRTYELAAAAFGNALSIEKGARAACLAGLSAAQLSAPDLPGDGFVSRTVASVPVDSALIRLSGSGTKSRAFPNAGDTAISPGLADLRAKVASLPELVTPGRFLVLGASEEDRMEWLRAAAEILRAAAAEAGLPVDLLAGIAWKEVGRKPALLDDVAGGIRRIAEEEWSPVTPENLPGPLGGDRDRTSYGPLSVQVRRAAEVLGYDPGTLTEPQREELLDALKDPAANIFIAAKHVANLKAATGFASFEDLTSEQYRELAARYNGGPYWRGGQAQAYAHDVEANLDVAGQAIMA
ncbi:MAG: hypothetical protein JWQ81_1382 [Amycolatopsis sp.]|uniref:hypothetical protein n=1 Tax=Amycolatopsis sp. TaxID=37632 RepID=UPI00262CAC69|nr:hypothetical protein [Amycolatopsis sp.]MCU1680643.1 hypothetical protein [Amycolatopsis sp.]